MQQSLGYTNPQFPRAPRHSTGDALFLALLLLAVGLLVWSKAAVEPLDHDEHQFVASGALLARRGLLPYVDYPYFHTPYLALLDAALFRLVGPTGPLLLAARALSAACGTATVGLIAGATLRAWRDARPAVRRAAAAAAALVLVANPVFAGTVAMAWNHDAGGLLLVGAVLLFLRAAGGQRGWSNVCLLCSGILLGLSVGVRLTAAPAAAALAGLAFADPHLPWRRRLRRAGLFSLGVAAALVPCALLLLRAPGPFLFGNFEYPKLNTAYRIAHHTMVSTTTPVGKLTYLFTRILFSSGSGFLAALVVLTLWALLARRARQRPPAQRSALAPTTVLGIVTLFLLSGSFAPAPLFQPYFYAPTVFVVLWLAYAWRPTAGAAPAPPWCRRSAALLVIACLACGVRSYRHVWAAFTPSAWVPLRVHDAGIELRRRMEVRRPPNTPAGPVLTLSPLIPLEGGLDVYETYATGPFAMRAAPMLSEDRREALGLTAEQDLPALCRRRPPGAVLVGLEGRAPEELDLFRGARNAAPQAPVIRVGVRDGQFVFPP